MKKLFLCIITSLLLITNAFAFDNPSFSDTGTFEVESAGLYTTYVYNPDYTMWQSIVDDWSTSCLLRDPWYSQPTLADHYSQDFAALFSVEVGDIGIVTDGGKKYYYVCTGLYDGYNAGDIYFIDGTCATDPYYGSCCDLMCYTCYHNLNVYHGVLIVIWDRCEEPETRKIVPYALWVRMEQ